MALSPVAGSWARWRPSSRAASIMSNMLGLPCLLLVVRAGPLPPGTFSIGRRRRNARKADDQAAALAEPGTGRSFGGRLQPWGPPARNRPRRAPNGPSAAIQAHQEESHGPASSLPRLSRPGTASAVRGGPVDRRGAPSGVFARTVPAGARRTRPADRRQPGRPRLGQRARPGVTAANERTGLLRGRRLPLQPRSALLPLVLQRRQGSRCRWRWWPWNWRGGWTFRWSE